MQQGHATHHAKSWAARIKSECRQKETQFSSKVEESFRFRIQPIKSFRNPTRQMFNVWIPFYKSGSIVPQQTSDSQTRRTSISHILELSALIVSFFHSYPTTCNASKTCDKPSYLGTSSSRAPNPLPGKESPRGYDIHGRESPFCGYVVITCLFSELKELKHLAGKANTKQSSASGGIPKTSSPVIGNSSTIASKSARRRARNRRYTTMVLLSPRRSLRRNLAATATCHCFSLKV